MKLSEIESLDLPDFDAAFDGCGYPDNRARMLLMQREVQKLQGVICECPYCQWSEMVRWWLRLKSDSCGLARDLSGRIRKAAAARVRTTSRISARPQFPVVGQFNL